MGQVRQWWMAKKKNWNCETPHDLETSCTLEPILSATCEKNLFCFILSSVSRKLHFSHTTGSHAIPTMQVTQWQIAVQIYSLSELWNTTWPEDSLHTRTHTSSCAGEKRFWLHSFLSPNVGCTSIPRGLYSTKHPFSLVKTASYIILSIQCKKMVLWRGTPLGLGVTSDPEGSNSRWRKWKYTQPY